MWERLSEVIRQYPALLCMRSMQQLEQAAPTAPRPGPPSPTGGLHVNPDARFAQASHPPLAICHGRPSCVPRPSLLPPTGRMPLQTLVRASPKPPTPWLALCHGRHTRMPRPSLTSNRRLPTMSPAPTSKVVGSSFWSLLSSSCSRGGHQSRGRLGRAAMVPGLGRRSRRSKVAPLWKQAGAALLCSCAGIVDASQQSCMHSAAGGLPVAHAAMPLCLPAQQKQYPRCTADCAASTHLALFAEALPVERHNIALDSHQRTAAGCCTGSKGPH